MSTKFPPVSKRPSMSRRFIPLSMTCVRPPERGFGLRAGTSSQPSVPPVLEPCIEGLQSLLRLLLHVAVQRRAVGVDPDRERPEVLYAELPEALRHEVLPLDLLDLLDLRGLECRRAADDREIHHAQ